MIDTCTDETGELDFSRKPHGSGMSRSAEVDIYLNFLFYFTIKIKLLISG